MERGQTPVDSLDRPRIVLLSKTQRNAQRAIELIWDSLWILNGGGIDLNEYPEVLPADGVESEDPWVKRSEFGPLKADRWGFQTSGILEACMIAAKASRRRSYTYAVHALGLSQSLATIHHLDLDPSHWRHRSAVSPFRRDHIRLAYAIIAAYACVEHLGLEIRASSTNPSKLNGEWNPVVKADLESRLLAANVDLAERALWTKRSTPRRVERSRPTRDVERPEWAGGRVRDTEVELIDAIADVSWLRSRISAHRLSSEAESLTVYEVSNAQYVARRLLLSALGLWRHWEANSIAE